MEEPASKPLSAEGDGGTNRRRRRRTRHHGAFHLHHAQKKLLARAGVFAAFLAAFIILWYWMAVRK